MFSDRSDPPAQNRLKLKKSLELSRTRRCAFCFPPVSLTLGDAHRYFPPKLDGDTQHASHRPSCSEFFFWRTGREITHRRGRGLASARSKGVGLLPVGHGHRHRLYGSQPATRTGKKYLKLKSSSEICFPSHRTRRGRRKQKHQLGTRFASRAVPSPGQGGAGGVEEGEEHGHLLPPPLHRASDPPPRPLRKLESTLLDSPIPTSWGAAKGNPAVTATTSGGSRGGGPRSKGRPREAGLLASGSTGEAAAGALRERRMRKVW